MTVVGVQRADQVACAGCKRVEGVPDDVKAFLENKKFDAVVRGPHWPAGGEEADVGEGEAQYCASSILSFRGRGVK